MTIQYDLSGVTDKFIHFQSGERKEYLEWEAIRQDQENEIHGNAKRSRKDQQHELHCTFQLIAEIHHHTPTFPGSFTGYPCNVRFVLEDNDNPNYM